MEEMDWGALLKLVPKFLSVLSWPSFTLIYPVYASVRAIESGSHTKNQQCLTYWVVFSLINILESSLPQLFRWLPFWPYAKGMATVLLVAPYFCGASYVYKRFIRPYISENSQTWIWNILFIPRRKEFIVTEQNNFLDVTEGKNTKNELEETEKHIVCQGLEPSCDTTERDYTLPTSSKGVQKEWSCALCLVSTVNEKCLEMHLRGKKHKAKEEELVDKLAMKVQNMLLKRTNSTGTALFQNLNQIAKLNLEKCCDLLDPVIWCTWKKPKSGWTKLNTDGSIDRENAGFGGLLRDYRGDPICAFVSKAPSRDDIFLVELWAIWRGLVLALGLGIKVIWVESDSMSVVNTINKKQSFSPKAGSCLKDIWELLNKFEKKRVSHSWRETNRAADHLAKMVLSTSDVVLWPAEFPNSLCNIIKEDAQGKKYRRR